MKLNIKIITGYLDMNGGPQGHERITIVWPLLGEDLAPNEKQFLVLLGRKGKGSNVLYENVFGSIRKWVFLNNALRYTTKQALDFHEIAMYAKEYPKGNE